MAFSTLFLYGDGDITRVSRLIDVSLTISNKHLLNYAVPTQDQSNYFYPFAEHDRWMHWSQNTAERHRLQGLKNVYMSRNPETANLTESELRQIVNDDGEDLQRIIANMQLFNSNIVGSNAYFYKHRRNLEGLVEAYGCPTIWFTFSVADNFWCDLHRLLGSSYLPDYNDMNEK